ncbi:MAG: hypothetical protein RLZZ269_543, partial [Actinomycetota bacterium]
EGRPRGDDRRKTEHDRKDLLDTILEGTA